jgi:hypothetical protein
VITLSSVVLTSFLINYTMTNLALSEQFQKSFGNLVEDRYT